MRNKTVLFLLLGGILVACSPLDEPPSGGDRRRPDIGGPSVAPDAPGQPAPKPDTILYYSAVRFPDGYDWQRDSAYGSVPFELILYRDDAPVLTLAWDTEACFGPDPDRHHLLGGHLYTERLNGAQTRVGCDGEELFRFDGREFLVGLLPDGTDLYTLSRNTSGSGFSYRKNGEILMEKPSGIPYGDLSDPSYAPTGALYRDGRAIVFCYRQGTALYQVVDGRQDIVANQTAGNGILDCKVGGGQAFVLRRDYLSQQLRDGRIWLLPTGSVVTGYFLSGQIKGYSGWMEADREAFPRQICREEALIYYSPEGVFALAEDAAGSHRWYGPDAFGSILPHSLFFSPKCASASDGKLILALTPVDTSQPPRLLVGTREKKLMLNGYVSAVAVELSLPAS